MATIIKTLLGWVLSPIKAVLNVVQLPSELGTIISQVVSYLQSGMVIFDWLCPLDMIKPAVVCFLACWGVKHAYDLVMWILRKIPVLGVS